MRLDAPLWCEFGTRERRGERRRIEYLARNRQVGGGAVTESHTSVGLLVIGVRRDRFAVGVFRVAVREVPVLGEIQLMLPEDRAPEFSSTETSSAEVWPR